MIMELATRECIHLRTLLCSTYANNICILQSLLSDNGAICLFFFINPSIRFERAKRLCHHLWQDLWRDLWTTRHSTHHGQNIMLYNQMCTRTQKQTHEQKDRQHPPTVAHNDSLNKCYTSSNLTNNHLTLYLKIIYCIYP